MQDTKDVKLYRLGDILIFFRQLNFDIDTEIWPRNLKEDLDLIYRSKQEL